MKNNDVPNQNSGASTDTISKRHCDTTEDAVQFYEVVKKRLMHVNGWNELAGDLTAKFQLRDTSGKVTNDQPKEGYYFSIRIPGPDNPSGDGDDWVKIKEIKDYNSADEAHYSITVKPAKSPLNEDKDVAHFFAEEASSTFIVKRVGAEVFAEVHGRNEKPNIKNVDASDKVRNAIVAIGGIMGFSKIQWKLLTNGLIEEEEE